MPKSPAQRAGLRLGPAAACTSPHPKDPAWAAWNRHIDARRNGSPSVLGFDQRLALMRNEVAVFGRVVTRALERF